MNDFVSGLHWYVVKTKPRSEEIAQSYLVSHGITTFLPWMQTLTHSSRNDLKPLFPGYLFVEFDVKKNYPLVKWGKGINKILGYGKFPTPVSNDVISIIKSKTNEDNVVQKAYQINKNDQVIVRSGPLKDLIGIFDRWVSESGRVRILLNLVGYQPHVDLHYSQLQKLA